MTIEESNLKVYINDDIESYTLNNREFKLYKDKKGEGAFYGFEVEYEKDKFVVSFKTSSEGDVFTNRKGGCLKKYYLYRYNKKGELIKANAHYNSDELIKDIKKGKL